MAVSVLLAPTAARAGDDINLYRFVLDVDVPESPALVAMDRAPTRVLLGTAPKPVMVTVLATVAERESHPGIALDLAPYFLFGGGVRSLASYRSNSVAGRLMRVLTKTTLSVAMLPGDGASGASRVGFGVRTTFHDLHDPILNSQLPERVAEALSQHGVSASADAEEDVSEQGVDLSGLFAETRRVMRARSGLKVTGGWGVAARAEDGVLSDDGLRDTRHTLWLVGHYTFGPRFDLLTTVQALDAFGSERALRAGAGVLRKSTTIDFRAELAYDGTDERLHPAVAIDVKLLPCTSVIASLTTEPDTATDARRLRGQVALRGYLARCR